MSEDASSKGERREQPRERKSSGHRGNAQSSARRTDRPRMGRPRSDGSSRTDRPRSDGSSRTDRGKPTGSRPSSGKGAAKPYAGKGASRPPREEERDRGPALPDEVTARDLPAPARNELKTLSKENADTVARHLAMAAQLIDDDPALAHEHALAAVKRAGRVAVVRETAAITAYATGDFALALRELRTYRRISGRDDQIALLVDSERGVGRPDRALEAGRAVDLTALSPTVRAELAVAMSGARLDLGDPERALVELDIPEMDPDRAFEWSPGLFAARATVLEELGRADEAAQWRRRAIIAAEALDAASGIAESEELIVEDIAPDEDIAAADEVSAPHDDEPSDDGGARPAAETGTADE